MFKSKEKRYDLAVENSAGGKVCMQTLWYNHILLFFLFQLFQPLLQLSYVIVDNEQVSKILIQKGDLQSRTTFIPMSQIVRKPWDPSIMRNAERLVNFDWLILILAN